MAEDRKSRRDELLNAARTRLAQVEEAADDGGGSSEPVGREIRYRGQVMRQSSTGTPGSGIGKRSSGRSGGKGSGGGEDVRAALQNIKDLYQDGLISRAEAERKRSEILDRL